MRRFPAGAKKIALRNASRTWDVARICSRRPIQALTGVLLVQLILPKELELELIQTQMAQKPMLRAEVYAHAMRASQNRKKEVRREKKV